MSDNAAFRTTDPLVARRELYSHSEGRRLHAVLHDHLGLQSGMRLLDAGCGYGAFAIDAATQHPNITVVGIDISPNMIAEAQRRALPNTSFAIGNIEDWKDGSVFDRILVLHTMHLTAHPDIALRNLLTQCKPGGRLVITLHSSKSVPFFHAWVEQFSSLHHLHYKAARDAFTIEKQRDLFAALPHTQFLHQEEHIVLRDPQPYLTYLATREDWERPLTSAERGSLLAIAEASIRKEIANHGVFREPVVTGIVVIDI